MDFELSVTASYISNEQKGKYEKLGFLLEPNEWQYNKGEKPWVRKSNPAPTLTIDTLEELMGFVKEYGQIILDEDTIEIYDDYRE